MIAKSSNEQPSQTLRNDIDDAYGTDDGDDNRRRLGVLKSSDHFPKDHADPTGANDTEDRRGPHVGFEPLQ